VYGNEATTQLSLRRRAKLSTVRIIVDIRKYEETTPNADNEARSDTKRRVDRARRKKVLRIVMKKLVFGALLLILVCFTLTLPSVRSDDGLTLTLRYVAWNIDYTASAVNVNRGQSVNLGITFTANVEVYDLRLQAISTPGSSLIADNVLGFQYIKPTEHQHHIFTVKIPDNAATGTYHIDLLIQGYNDAAFLEWYPYWYCRGFFCTGENPQYTQDTTKLSGNSIVLTVT